MCNYYGYKMRALDLQREGQSTKRSSLKCALISRSVYINYKIKNKEFVSLQNTNVIFYKIVKYLIKSP